MNKDLLTEAYLPDFGEEVEPLSGDEITTLRKIILDYKKNDTAASSVQNKLIGNVQTSLFGSDNNSVSALFSEEPDTKEGAESSHLKEQELLQEKGNFALKLLEKQRLGEPTEVEALKAMIDSVKNAEGESAEYLAVAILGLVPCKKFIRHGTPEQKLFVLKTLGDRFLDSIAGVKWADRRKLVKAVANYLSSLSDNHNFIPMEGEAFKPTLHERVVGSSASGAIIKEMRGFLVVTKDANRITYSGLVFT